MNNQKYTSITVLVPAGRLPLEIMEKAHQLAKRHDLEIYLSTLQNLRLNNVPESEVSAIKEELALLGANFKAKGLFPNPRVCVGAPHCNLGLIDTEKLSSAILDYFSSREKTKAKIKIAIAGCTLCCSGTKTTDIAIEATRKGYTVYAGGKAGIAPKVGRRIKRNVEEQEVLETIKTLVDFHDTKTGKKQRMFKLLSDADFPFPEV